MDMIYIQKVSDRNGSQKSVSVILYVLTGTQVLPCDDGLGNIKFCRWLWILHLFIPIYLRHHFISLQLIIEDDSTKSAL